MPNKLKRTKLSMVPSDKPLGIGMAIAIIISMTLLGGFVFTIVIFPIMFIIFDYDTTEDYTMPLSFIAGFISSICYIMNKDQEPQSAFSQQVALRERIGSHNINPYRTYNKNNISFIVDKDMTHAYLINSITNSTIKLHKKDIIEIALEVDDSPISKMSSGMTGGIIGASIGGLTFGGFGAIAGSIIGKNPKIETSSEIGSIKIKIAARKIKNNLLVLDFMGELAPTKKDNKLIKAYLKEADEWWATLTVLINSSDSVTETLAKKPISQNFNDIKPTKIYINNGINESKHTQKIQPLDSFNDIYKHRDKPY